MNLLKHYIVNIHSEKDATSEFTKYIGHSPYERLFLVDMDIDCCGIKERVQEYMFESLLKEAKEKGFYEA